ncbi:MAG: NAD(P)H-dependent oxidoreductase subunit E [Nitrospirae bacterium]|nr:NAD(P)H-dependent oxidoreductase subunit E [Nitrospirota bacterium]
MKQTILGLMKKFPCTDSAILPSLCFIQKEKGHISEDDMKELSGILQFSEARIYSAASFYSMLRLKPRARYHIQVCANVSCSLLETESLLDYISGKLGIGEGEMTPDGLFSLEPVECLGSCGYAPAMMINTEHYENMSFEKADEVIEMIRRELPTYK